MGVRSVLRQSRGLRGISSPGRASGSGIPRSPWQPCPPAYVCRADNGELKKTQVISVIGHLLYAGGTLRYISKVVRLCGALPLHPDLLQGTEYKTASRGWSRLLVVPCSCQVYVRDCLLWVGYGRKKVRNCLLCVRTVYFYSIGVSFDSIGVVLYSINDRFLSKISTWFLNRFIPFQHLAMNTNSLTSQWDSPLLRSWSLTLVL